MAHVFYADRLWCRLDARSGAERRAIPVFWHVVGGDDDAPVSLGAFWRRPMRIVGVVR